MKSFSDYISEKDEEKFDETETLNEEVATIIMAVFGLPTIAALIAWGASIVLTSYGSFLGKITGKIIRIWRDAFKNVKGSINSARIQTNLKEMSRDTRVKRAKEETEKDKRIFSDELSNVYAAIESKDFSKAKESFSSVPKDIQNNPDVHRVLISEISKSLQEPPLYVSSPGNKTYQAIKKIMNIRIARAAALATKMSIEKELNNDKVRELESEVEQE